jgi:hypothetical protein
MLPYRPTTLVAALVEAALSEPAAEPVAWLPEMLRVAPVGD